MTNGDNNRGPILRLFEVRVKKGCVDTLVQNFATTSADVVRSEPGNRGYFFGQEMSVNEEKVVFASVWRDLDAVKQRFGASWRISFLPEGYEDLIEDCSVRHIDLSDGWHVRPAL